MRKGVKKDTTNISNNNTNNINSNSNNKTFNLQVFLNETCKDALNISDFVNQITPTEKKNETNFL